jgi:hypothetical protein
VTKAVAFIDEDLFDFKFRHGINLGLLGRATE